jgi:geranylgeranyl diphosphate synthase type II
MPADAVDLSVLLEKNRRLVEGLLDRYLPSAQVSPKALHAAMRYSVMAGGKRLRPLLAAAAFSHCGGVLKGEDLPIHLAMAALEMVHTYSLIHDDLPCMDDDDLRRGVPTCHKKFGEAVAVLAGDALHDAAFALMARTGSLPCVVELAEAIGTNGMIAGQVADVEAEGCEITCDEITWIHQRKTGALIRCAVRVGAILAGADESLIASLSRYGEKIGLAFQIVDDILDIEGDQELLGKKTGSDRKKQKATYPGVVGVQSARRDAERLLDEAVSGLDAHEPSVLKHIADYIGQRQR